MVDYLDELHDRGATDWIVQHAQSHEDADRLVGDGSEIFGSEPLFCTQVGPVLGAHLGWDARRRDGARLKPFRLEIPDAALDDLHERLGAHPLARGRDGRRLVAGHPARLHA